MQGNSGFDTPVAFLIFNRPENTRKVFAAIRERKPAVLLVVADGPRDGRPGESERCQETRAIVDQGVDWDCKVLKEYSDVNLGCRNRISSGLSWVFREVEEAIILEDDCIPHPGFFDFCREMLLHYRNDERIFTIGGSNIQPNGRKFPYSYYCSPYPQIWGWATWRRSWAHYDVAMKRWPEAKSQGLLDSSVRDLQAKAFWHNTFDRCLAGSIDTWDYQLTFSCMMQHGLNLISTSNLISNIGFDADATHTTRASAFADMPHVPLKFPLRHPGHLFSDPNAERYFHRNVFRSGLKGLVRHVVKRLLSKDILT